MLLNSLIPVTGRGGNSFHYYTMSFNDDHSRPQHHNISSGEGSSLTKVYIGGLIDDIGNDKLQYEFEKFGKIMKVWVARSPHSNGYAFVDFFETNDAARAVEQMNGKHLFGGKIIVQFSKTGKKKNIKPFIEKNSVDRNMFSSVKYDYDSDYKSRKERINSLDRSSRKRSRSREPRYKSCNLDQRLNRDRSPSSTVGRYSERYRSRRRDSRDYGLKRTRSPSREYDSSRSRHRSREEPPNRNFHERDRRSTNQESFEFQTEKIFNNFNSSVDNETIQKIKESVVKETLPQIYSMFLREILLNTPANLQNGIQNSTDGYSDTRSIKNMSYTNRGSLPNNKNGNISFGSPPSLMNFSSPSLLPNSYNNSSILPTTFALPVTTPINASTTYSQFRDTHNPSNNFTSPVHVTNSLQTQKGIDNPSPLVQGYLPPNIYNYRQHKNQYKPNTPVPPRISQSSAVSYPQPDSFKGPPRLPVRSLLPHNSSPVKRSS